MREKKKKFKTFSGKKVFIFSKGWPFKTLQTHYDNFPQNIFKKIPPKNALAIKFKIFSQKYARNKKLPARSSNCNVSKMCFPNVG